MQNILCGVHVELLLGTLNSRAKLSVVKKYGEFKRTSNEEGFTNLKNMNRANFTDVQTRCVHKRSLRA